MQDCLHSPFPIEDKLSKALLRFRWRWTRNGTPSPTPPLPSPVVPELNGIEAARQIRREMPSVEILILTMHHSDALIAGALEAGARGCIRQVRSPTLPLEVTLKRPLLTSHTRGYDW